ncbi:MAG: hypothetical protein RBU27_10335 [Bacteroidota bacterium]|nr:hypothetical protein [Bacteroidota bacterium]
MSVRIETTAEQCVWVSAGVLNYKLCDRGFDCEHCPLDAALRDHGGGCDEDESGLTLSAVEFPAWNELAPELQPLFEPFRSLSLCDTARYSSRHVWVRQLPSGMLRLGLDAFAAALIPDDAQLVTVAHGSELREGEAFGWVYAWNKTLPLPAPVSGHVICRSGRGLESVANLRGNPYTTGSLLTIQPTLGTMAEAPVRSARVQRTRFQRGTRALADRLMREASRADLGLCLNDGGAPVHSLPEMLGQERFWKLLQQHIGGGKGPES